MRLDIIAQLVGNPALRVNHVASHEPVVSVTS
jgi:hypothetical protein